MRTLLLTGPPGAGKTTTLTALMGRLEAEDVRFAAVELEALALVHPWPDDDAALDHLAALAASFERRGYPLLLITATTTGRPMLERVRAALPAGEVVVVALTASPDRLRERITRREPAGWVGLPRLLGAVEGLARETAALPGVDLRLDTGAEDLERVVGAVRASLRG